MAQHGLSHTRNVLDAYQNREFGLTCNQNIAPELLAVAEDRLVLKDHNELSCEMPGLPRSTFLMVFSPDGSKVASTHGNHNVYVTDLRTGKNINTLVGHPRTPWSIAFHPSSNHILATGCLGGQVRVWDLSGGSEVWTTSCNTVIASLAFHPLDRLLVIATFNELYFWDWSQPRPFMQACTRNIKEKVRYVAFDRLGHKLITGVANMPTSRWDRQPTATTNRCVHPHNLSLSPAPVSNLWYHRRRRESNVDDRSDSVESSNTESTPTNSNERTSERQTPTPTPPETTTNTATSEPRTPTTRTATTNTSPVLLRAFKINYSALENNSRSSPSQNSSSYQNSEPGPSGINSHANKQPRTEATRSNSRSSDSSLSSDSSDDLSLVPYMVITHKLKLASAMRDFTSTITLLHILTTSNSNTNTTESQPSTSTAPTIRTTTVTPSSTVPPTNENNNRPSLSNRQFSISESSAFIPATSLNHHNSNSHSGLNRSSTSGQSETAVPRIVNQLLNERTENANNGSENRNDDESSSPSTLRGNQDSDLDQSPPRRYSRETRTNESENLTTQIFENLYRSLENSDTNFLTQRTTNLYRSLENSDTNFLTLRTTNDGEPNSSNPSYDSNYMANISPRPENSSNASRNRILSHLAESNQAELRQIQMISQISEAVLVLLMECTISDEPGTSETNENPSENTERSARTHPEEPAESAQVDTSRPSTSRGPLHIFKRRRAFVHCRGNVRSLRLPKRPGVALMSSRRHYPQPRIVFYNNSQPSSSRTPSQPFGYAPNIQEIIPLTPEFVTLMINQIVELIRIQQNQPQHRFFQQIFQTERQIARRLYQCQLAIIRQGIRIEFEPRQLIDFTEYTGEANILFRSRYMLSAILNRLVLFFETNPTLTRSFHNRVRVLIKLCFILSESLLLNIVERIPTPGITHSARLRSQLQLVNARLERERRYFQAQLSRYLNSLAESQTINIEDLLRMSVPDNDTSTFSTPSSTNNNSNNSTSNTNSNRNPGQAANSNESSSNDEDDNILTSLRGIGARLRNIVGQISAQQNDNTNNQIQEVANVIYRTRAMTQRIDDITSAGLSVPQVQVNDIPVSEPTSPTRLPIRVVTQHRLRNLSTFRPRYLHPLYAGINPFDAGMDEPQREQVFGIDTDYPTAVYPNHRIQVWNMADGTIPNIKNSDKNLVVSECRIHNDASVDISRDGNLLVTLLPSGGYLNITNKLGVFSIQWDNLGQCLYTASFEQNAVSVSLSATSRYLAVGLASRRISLVPGNERCIMAQLYKLETNGRAVLARDIEKSRDLGYTSVNCIRWSPVPGQGLVYATNTGHLKVLT